MDTFQQTSRIAAEVIDTLTYSAREGLTTAAEISAVMGPDLSAAVHSGLFCITPCIRARNYSYKYRTLYFFFILFVLLIFSLLAVHHG